ncbi:hypothetical protein [Fictibacillus halophilus]|nr:hypothetical protein [Fictibacillus halophilus]
MSNRVELRYEEYFKAFLFKKFDNGRVIVFQGVKEFKDMKEIF